MPSCTSYSRRRTSPERLRAVACRRRGRLNVRAAATWPKAGVGAAVDDTLDLAIALEREGRLVVVTAFTSVTTAARLDVMCAADTLETLSIHWAPPHRHTE